MALAPSELLRRTLLVLVTALIVARPLVLGEDPGLAALESDSGSMVLSLLWLVAGVGWAAWRLWARRGEWYVGAVEAGLGFAVVFFIVSAQFAANRHPARIIAWEWLILLVGFVVVRHLAATADVRQGLFAVLLATGVMVSAYAIYQAVVEVPDLKRQSREDLRLLVAKHGMKLDDAQLEMMHRRIQDGHVFSTFAHPNSCAGYLILLLPGLVGAVVVTLRSGASMRLARLAALAAVIGFGGLWVTHSRGAILALAAVGLGVAAIVWRRQLLERKVLAFSALAVVAVSAIVVLKSGVLSSGFGKDTGTMAARLDYWRATAKMIADRPWVGVGPGNFGSYYPRYMAETAGEKIKDPHNFVLELWATGGVFVLLAMLGALAAFGAIVWRGLRTGGEEVAKPQAAEETVRWEYYIGGVIGLLIGFALRLSVLDSADAILQEGLSAAARSIVWFGALALFERVRWTDGQRVVALTAGVAACLLNLGVSGGIGQPSVAGPLWFAIALTLASLPSVPRVFSGAPLPSLGLPVAALTALAALYLVFCFYPVTTSLSLMRLADANSQLLQPERTFWPSVCASSVGLCASTPQGMNVMAATVLRAEYRSLRDYATRAPAYLEEKVLAPLREAARSDPDNPRVWTQLGTWYGHLWEFQHDQDRSSKLIGGAFHNAQASDPNGLEPLLAEVQLQRTFAHYSRVQADGARRAREAGKPDPKLSPEDWAKRQKALEDMEKQSKRWEADHYQIAILKLGKVVKLDPTDARLHFQLAELMNEAGERDDCRNEAQEALRLHELSTMPTRRLADRQRQQAEAWVTASPDR